MKLNFILLGIGCMVTMTGTTLSTTESRSQELQLSPAQLMPPVPLYKKKDSILTILKQKDDAIEMKLNKLERQLYLLKKENKRINRLLRIKNEALAALQDTLIQTQAAAAISDSSMLVPADSSTLPPDVKTNFWKKLLNKLKLNN